MDDPVLVQKKQAMLLRLADLADQILAIDGVTLPDLEARHLTAVRGGDHHFL